MYNYIVVNCSICFGFGGYHRRAFRNDDAAAAFAAEMESSGRYTSVDLYETTAPNAKAAIKAGPSLFSGSFAGIDARRV